MEEFNFEKLEKRLKNLDLPDFELAEAKKLLRYSLLDSPHFKRKGFRFSFRILIPSLGTLSAILLAVLFGYPYFQSSYLKAKAEGILDKTTAAVKSLGPDRNIYVSTSGKNEIVFPFEKIPKTTLDNGKEDSAEKTVPSEEQKSLQKIELNLGQLKEAKDRGDIKFFQYAGEEKRKDATLNKIRYVDKDNVVTEIKINAQTNLPVEIITWFSKEKIEGSKAAGNALPEKETLTEIRVIEMNPQKSE